MAEEQTINHTQTAWLP